MRGLLLIVLLVVLGSCQKAKLNKTGKVLIEHSWKIDEIIINGDDVTDLGYNEYLITFSTKNSETHAKISSLQTDVKGNWSLQLEDKKATLILKMENPLGKITANWQVMSVSKSKLLLSTKGSNKITLLAQD